MLKGIKKARVYCRGKGVIETPISLDGKYINGFEEVNGALEIPKEWIVCPGFIDQHIHGAAGYDAMDADPKAIGAIATAVVKEGTTAFLATTMTQSPEKIHAALKGIREYMDSNMENGAEVLGVHLEGPFIGKEYVGAQPIEYVERPSVTMFDRYQRTAKGAIKLVTLAPEVDGAIELITHLSKNGVVASAGHTNAVNLDIEKGIECGLRNVTHTYNAQRPIHHREIGTVGAAMLRDELNCEVICDLIHVSLPAIKLLLKNKPLEKVSLITDAMRAKHMPDGDYELGGQPVIVKNGEARLTNGTLAGSVLKMNHAVRNLVENGNLPLEIVLDYATINPAKLLGVDEKMGSIENGKLANFAILDEEFEVQMTIREGRIVYEKARQ